MGAIQEPTPAMGPYRVELRGESFYLTRLDADPERSGAPSRYEARVPVEDVHALLAAIDQVTEHPWWAKRERPAEGTEPDLSWALPPGADEPLPDAHWTVALGEAAITIRGPWCVHHEVARQLLSAELCYRDLAELRDVLTTVSV